MRLFACLLALFLFPLPAAAQDPAMSADAPEPPAESPAEAQTEAEKYYYYVAVLQGLNKVTARISELKATVGTSVHFGNLEIIVQHCWQSPPTERPENAILMEIWERRTGEAAINVFHGWMFSSSPSLSGLEHPVYDITALRCEKRELGVGDIQ